VLEEAKKLKRPGQRLKVMPRIECDGRILVETICSVAE
jgi:hypothetical protein